jgi:hypothetical protein
MAVDDTGDNREVLVCNLFISLLSKLAGIEERE